MRLFNTLSQQIEPFVVHDNEVKLYVCGVTPYDTAHLGHAFIFGTFDILIRYLRSQELRVVYVQNVTDIDDPLFKKARELGITWMQLAQQETERFVREMSAINVAMPDHFIRASDHVEEMTSLIEKLLQSGNAYINDGWVYFNVRSDPQFARLAFAKGLMGYDQLLTANVNRNDVHDPRKHNPLDFLLWRGAVAGEPSWESPWGQGHPGWHIECSAMATHFLGSQLDIHGGGSDLIFPHHSCEIAQAEHATGVRPYARYWIHVGMVEMAKRKMSKTEGNLMIVHNLLKIYSADALRLLLATHHYRQDWEFTFPDMESAQRLAEQIMEAAQGDISPAMPTIDSPTDWTKQAFLNALENDLDTPRAVRILGNLASACLAGILPDNEMPIARLQIRSMADLLGLRLDKDS
jgi:L-cysteine:1D-myo-inositol 2-amino-2-deoxy-alpha-D-glucopyranoside ligase